MHVVISARRFSFCGSQHYLLASLISAYLSSRLSFLVNMSALHHFLLLWSHVFCIFCLGLCMVLRNCGLLLLAHACYVFAFLSASTFLFSSFSLLLWAHACPLIFFSSSNFLFVFSSCELMRAMYSVFLSASDFLFSYFLFVATISNLIRLRSFACPASSLVHFLLHSPVVPGNQRNRQPLLWNTTEPVFNGR